ncbi:hypothetical protein CISIN_1g000572mg [Citrus sinensis]|uniref:Uncharacterized protein n=1 Tax=Citrus sinensis TaxID=2711 RepID=A0A067FP30_CITSI|nr:hypothetical protein CISIN_1g000572mg [Citrus sinensis]
MSGLKEITAITEADFLQGTHRNTLFLNGNSAIKRKNLLWGALSNQNSKFGISNRKSVSLKCCAQSKPRAVVSGDKTASVDEQPNLSEKPAQEVVHFYRIPLLQDSAAAELLKSVQKKISNQIVGLKTEHCFNIGLDSRISTKKLEVLKWLLQETYEPENLGTESFLEKKKQKGLKAVIVEVGPRLSFTTAWSANAVSICRVCGLTEVTRLERSRRYLLFSKGALQDNQINDFAAMVHDRMTECVYTEKLTSFETSVVPEEVRFVPVMENGRKALEEINQEMGLAFDEQDLQYYTRLFKEDIKRNPTTVELFDIAQSNSEHSRHWFFTGKIVIDGKPMVRTLMQIVKSTLQANPNNSVIGFKDNSSAIKGFPVKQLRPVQPGSRCQLSESSQDLDVLFTAETHNFPCAVAPYPGAETGAGLVAQQQTVGPLQITLADVAVIAQTYTDLTGGACAIGEQPIKGLLNPKAMARLAVGEALTNLVWAKVTSLSHVKASGNWMYAAKLDGEGAAMYDAATALAEAMIELGIAIDGGKDSLSMAAYSGGEVVKAPGSLVISVYVTCPDITKTVTPDLKLGDDGILLHIDLAKGKRRLGGSALAQVFDQVGNESPDLEDVPYLKRVFETVQDLIGDELVSTGHDISDGGLLVCTLEMSFAGNYGITLDLNSEGNSLFQTLFAEELGLVLEVSKSNLDTVSKKLHDAGVSAEIIGQVNSSHSVEIKVDGLTHLNEKTSLLRDMWEETSFELEKFQRLASCVESEKEGLKSRCEPLWKLSFTPSLTDEKYMNATSKPKVAVIREEGSNGDREMSAAFYAAGFEPWDVTMSDLINGAISLDEFRGIVFVGGFSYADVLDSAKGWSASIRFNQPLLNQFQEFYKRPDTFSLGVCNGCQLMALLGWIPGPQVGGVHGAGGDPSQPRFVHNESGRFECRFSSVTIEDSPAIMLKGMEGSTLGVWAAHGEGRAYFPDDGVLDRILHSHLAPVRYCDDDGNPTEVYPFNVNGSPLGVAAICSPDGRHLAMMPHPERCFLMWQYPWYPKNWNVDKKGPSPWLKMFQNAREWCS